MFASSFPVISEEYVDNHMSNVIYNGYIFRAYGQRKECVAGGEIVAESIVSKYFYWCPNLSYMLCSETKLRIKASWVKGCPDLTKDNI